MNNQEKGLLYERYVKDFIISHLYKNAYLWNECPENILIEYNLIHSHNDMRLLRKDIKEGHLHSYKDIGIDIIQIDNNNISIIQCKNGYNNGLCVDDISGIMMRSNFLRDINTYIYYTNSLSRNIKYTANLSPYVSNFDCSNKKEFEIPDDKKIFFIKLPYEENTDIIKLDIKPYSYQLEAFNKFNEYFINNNRGILSLPCGCGKTYTSYLISEKYSHIIIISPLKEFANQNLNRFIEYGYNKLNTLLVDSDGIRDIENIKKFIKENEKLIISTTYNSMDLISNCLNLFNNPLFIIDEFHNLSKANINDETNDIYKLLISNHKILFMSATPRIYDIEYDEELNDIEWLFGNIIYQMKFNDAISNKYITDYKIWLPSIHENNEELDKELSIYDIDDDIKNRCKFLFSCISNNGSRKCIIYCKDTNDMMNMIQCIKSFNEFYIMDIEINSINCEDTEKNRKERINYFSNNNKIQLLFNIRILNECIDIPACDSIYISYPPKNKITTIQRISRATRIDKKNPHKISNIYIWCNEYEEILETLSTIKEYDIMFIDKIKINSLNFYNNKTENEIKIFEDDKKLLNNYIIDIKEFKHNTWDDKLKIIEDYIIKEGKRPSSSDKNKIIRSYGRWILHQEENYKINKQIMKNEDIRNKWKNFKEKYEDLFMSNEEIWNKKFRLVEEYIIKNGKKPPRNIKDIKNKILSKWIDKQIQNYRLNDRIMKNENIRKQWEEFSEKYKEILYKTNIDIWYENLNLLEEFIIKYNKKPDIKNKDNEVKILNRWLVAQQLNYKNKEYIMNNKEVYNSWKEFTMKYNHIFKSNEENWNDKLLLLIKYIDENKKRPSCNDNDDDIAKLGQWLILQTRSYKNNLYAMKNENIKKQWTEFLSKYSQYL